MSPFGQQTRNGTFSALGDNSFLNRETTLYCMAENQNMTQVTWIYTDISEYSTVLSATTDAITGVSSLNVTNDKPGHTRTYTTVMFNPGDYML